MARTSTSATRSKSTGSVQNKKDTGSSSARSGQGSNDSRRMNIQSDAESTARSNSKTAGSSDSDSQQSFKGESYLEKFFMDLLMDIYYAEQKIAQSLPKLKEAATTQELKDAFEDHLHQTERHVKRLEKAFSILGKKAEGKKCEAIEGIVKEVEQIIEETDEGTMTRDAALIIAAQKVEHYEIATYGGIVQLAITMDLQEVADLLDKTLVEEEDTDSRLTEIAENEVNLGAEHEGNDYSWNK